MSDPLHQLHSQAERLAGRTVMLLHVARKAIERVNQAINRSDK